jgi:CHAT domain-containing protein
MIQAIRCVVGLALLLILVGPRFTGAAAQSLSVSTTTEEVFRLIVIGRNIDAIDRVKVAFEGASPADKEDLFPVAVRACIALRDFGCAVHFANHPFVATLTPSKTRPLLGLTVTLLFAYVEVVKGNLAATEQALSSNVPLAAASPAGQVTFVEFQLLAAERARRLSDFDSSRESLDKALAATLTFANEEFEAIRLLVRIAAQFLDNHDDERASRLVIAAMPLLLKVPRNSFAAFELGRLFATLLRQRGGYAGVVDALQGSLSTLDAVQLRPELKSFLRAIVYNDLVAAEVLRGDVAAARRLLQSHPLMSSKPEIISRGYFMDGHEFGFALAEEFVRFALQDPAETGWHELLIKPPKWTNDREALEEIRALAEAAIGLRLARMGKAEEARRHFVDAARIRLPVLLDQHRKSTYGVPLPSWTDNLILQFAVGSTAFSGTPDYDLILSAHLVLGRSIESSADDAATNQAFRDADDEKRIAQSLRIIDYQRAAWEKTKVGALLERLGSQGQRDPDQAWKERLNVLSYANDLIEEQQRLRTAFSRWGNAGAGPISDLATVKQLLLPDEALVFYIPAVEAVAKVCVRTDQNIMSVQKLDETVGLDARLLRAALTAAHPASAQADSQFPVAEAIRLRNVMFGGLEECLNASKRIYYVPHAGGLIAQVPPAALLAETPPRLGSGFDLKAARWMIRNHSFVRVSSINAFVAAKRLTKAKRASLDYLGVGDPVLSSRDASSPAGGVFAARGSVPVLSGALTSLQELPETSSELDQVSRLFDASKTRTLRREAASEEEFRLQPLSEFDILHFATHGLIREELPGIKEPALVLTPNPAGDTFNDGLLTTSQIAALPLRARLVILSACNSARYDATVIDSGIQGLSTSFLIAGVPTMIAALWPIESSVTRDLIIAAFREARGPESTPIADALAVAVRKHLDGPTPRPLLHPRFWAALTVLGDGSMTLNAPGQDGVRDLRAYSPAQSLKGDEIISVVPSGDDFASSTIGEWNGKRSPSLVRRHAFDGTTKWEVEDFEIGVGPVSATDATIYAGGYVSQLNGTFSVPVLRRLSPDGHLLWSRQLPTPGESSMIKALATTADGSALLLIGPSQGDKAETALSLVRIDPDGAEVERVPLRIFGDARLWLSGSLKIDKAESVAIINRGLHLESKPDQFNTMGMPLICSKGDAANIVFLDTASLRETRRTEIDSFEASSAIRTNDGWLVIGKLRAPCRFATHAAAYLVKSDGSATEFWRDTSPFSTSAVAIRRTDGAFEIIGKSRRSIAIEEGGRPWTLPDFSSKRSGGEAYLSDEIFSVRLTDQGSEQRRDFVGAGFPLMPMGMGSTPAHSVIYGTVGGRPLWLSR